VSGDELRTLLDAPLRLQLALAHVAAAAAHEAQIRSWIGTHVVGVTGPVGATASTDLSEGGCWTGDRWLRIGPAGLEQGILRRDVGLVEVLPAAVEGAGIVRQWAAAQRIGAAGRVAESERRLRLQLRLPGRDAVAQTEAALDLYGRLGLDIPPDHVLSALLNASALAMVVDVTDGELAELGVLGADLPTDRLLQLAALPDDDAVSGLAAFAGALGEQPPCAAEAVLTTTGYVSRVHYPAGGGPHEHP
jgi:hypothetical protein